MDAKALAAVHSLHPDRLPSRHGCFDRSVERFVCLAFVEDGLSGARLRQPSEKYHVIL